jgi:dTDP-4-amino-4,6-dideoxygalactose transaminase
MAEPRLAFVDLQAQKRRLGSRVQAAVDRVLAHGRFIMGPDVDELERRLEDHSGAPYAVTCASGTDALLLPLLAWGVGPGDAIVVPSFTFAATAEVVALVGATPVFADVDAVTYNLDPASAEEAVQVALRGDLRPVGIIAVDLFGQPADYDALGVIAAENGLRLIADAAQSYGATRGDRTVGTLCEVTTTSFFPSKPLGCYGDGGAVLTDDEDLAALMRSIRVHGQGDNKYDNVRVGLNSRLDTVQAAVLLEKLSIFDEELRLRRELARGYTEALHDVVDTPIIDEGCDPSWAQYTVQLRDRDEVAHSMKEAGVPTAIYYPRPLHEQPAYRRFPTVASLERSAALAARVLSLPMHPYLDDAGLERITGALRRSVRSSSQGGR